MKKVSFILGLSLTLFMIGCNKEDECVSGGSTCFECTDCQGQYGHLINGEYCIDGFDNCEDWKNAKTNYETNEGCNCEFTN